MEAAIREGRATAENALAVVSPVRMKAAWALAEDVPPKALPGLAALRAEDFEEAARILCKDPAKHVECLRDRWAAVGPMDYPPERLYRETVRMEVRKAYAPEVPEECRWTRSLYSTMARHEGVTPQTELSAAFALHGIDDESERREIAEYVATIDAALREYRNRSEGIRSDERKNESKERPRRR